MSEGVSILTFSFCLLWITGTIVALFVMNAMIELKTQIGELQAEIAVLKAEIAALEKGRRL